MTVFNETALAALAGALTMKGKYILAFLSEQAKPVAKEKIQIGVNEFYQKISETDEILFNSRKVFDDNIERLEGAALIEYTEHLGRAKWYQLTEGGHDMLNYLERKGS